MTKREVIRYVGHKARIGVACSEHCCAVCYAASEFTDVRIALEAMSVVLLAAVILLLLGKGLIHLV